MASSQEEDLTQNGLTEIATEKLVTANDWYKAAQDVDIKNKENAEKKIGYYQQVINLDSNNISALWGISWTYSELNDIQNASEYLERILQLLPLDTYFLDKKSFYLAQGKNEYAMAIRDKINENISNREPLFATERGAQNASCDQSSVLSGTEITKSGCL